MKRTIALILLFFMVLLGGCQIGIDVKPSEMNPNDLPDERAFQDEFTREFLQSAEETRPGYYPFLSKTGRYEMDFPAGGVIGETSYSINKSSFEFIAGGIQNNINSGFTLIYYGESNKDNINERLIRFKKRIGKEFEFNINERNNSIVHHYQFIRNNFDKNVAYIQNSEASGAIEIIYTVNCDSLNECDKKVQKKIKNYS